MNFFSIARNILQKSTKTENYIGCFIMIVALWQKKVYHPLLKKTIDFEKSELYKWSNDFLSELRKKRKFALRLGKLGETQAHYNLRPDITKKLCNNRISLSELTENDFTIKVEQKGVDMRIGLDISSMAYKKQVEQVILISGDSDFVPAAKLARREGIDFILDPMGSNIKTDLEEHIDGIRSMYKYFVTVPVGDSNFK